MTDLERRIGHVFGDRGLLAQVFTHRSSRHENPNRPGGDNERLEYLGDAILGCVVSRMLFERYPEKSEGALSRSRARLVSARHLSSKARALGLGEELRLGRGEELSGGRDKDSILADTYESLIAGVFLDGGMKAAVSFIEREYAVEVETVDGDGWGRDSKSRLQERLHASGTVEPSYEVIEESGPDHLKEFEVAVLVEGVELARGRGSSKKAAQQAAARRAMEILDERDGDDDGADDGSR